MGLGELYALICALLWASAVVMFKHAGDSLSANTLNLVKNLIGVLLLLPTAVLLEGLSLPALNTSEWLILAASGYLGIAVADTWYFQALRYLGAARTAIVASLYSPFVVILSIIFLGERLQTWQWIGFALVMLGILVVVYQRYYVQVERQALFKGMAFAASAVLFTAAGVVAMKPILVHEGFFWLVTMRMLAGVLGMLIFIALRQQVKATYTAITTGPHPWRLIFIASIFATYLAMIFWLAGFKYADASVASVLNETSNVFIVLMAWLFLKEGLGARRVLGVGLTFAGVLVFLWLVA